MAPVTKRSIKDEKYYQAFKYVLTHTYDQEIQSKAHSVYLYLKLREQKEITNGHRFMFNIALVYNRIHGKGLFNHKKAAKYFMISFRRHFSVYISSFNVDFEVPFE
ncbi:hypothetical protein SS50377_26930 [Spironucleus salmonicida]|uniref:Uncharacterized protein n=1 Tax=Spironucleus salmonicida TaxID=348837 RepID=V6LUQ8_9EUKA|nr:hypothetical protein SS50377_26930 [Spironucleus salmonicida]|eukprot:EST47441.1 Hypothetical protein SS50377_12427 [Spironucleus salmonicida]